MARRAAAQAATFPTVRTEGGLLPADLLAGIADLDANIDLLDSASYGLETGQRLTDAIHEAWASAQAAWLYFTRVIQREKKGESRVSLTRDYWMRPLLKELGYEELVYHPAAEVVGDRRFLVTFRAGMSEDTASPPVHLVSWDDELEARGRRSAGLSPHALVQEYLNWTDHLWGIASNGRKLRLLRDNQSMSRAAYVEFDLEAMMREGAYADFRLLWLVLHRSRLPGPEVAPDSSPLERWRVAAEDRGARALNDLRAGVRAAIQALGQGFLSHPANREALHARLASGELSTEDYYRQLLRLVYRMIFLFAAEERDLLLPEEATLQQRDTYRRCYSATRLRDLVDARRGRDRHDDLWRGLQVLFRALSGAEDGPSPLGLRPLGGLFEPGSLPDLEGAAIDNTALLDAVRGLSYARTADAWRRVNYRDMDVEELGSVYEGLLDEQPALSGEGATRRFEFRQSGERKSTGSYYTNPGLVAELVRSALDPVIQRALAAGGTEAERRQRLLDLKVCDPACGSGHFLLAAARRIGREVARLDAGGNEPTPELERRALREAIRHCVYGVDLNELAVDLCRTALWLEGHDPGKPMAFLDAHVRRGNSLVGATEAAMATGIPDDAFDPVTGDEKAYASAVRKRNRAERTGQHSFEASGITGWTVTPVGGKPVTFLDTAATPDDSVTEVRAKRKAWQDARRMPAAVHKELVADLWTAAFFWPLREGMAPPPTERTWRRLAGSDQLVDHLRAETRDALRETADGRTVAEARRLKRDRLFFHWELEFPEVFGREEAGFDCILGNPPWERVKLQEQEFFAQRDPEIAAAPNAAARKRLIAALEDGPDPRRRVLFAEYREALRSAEQESAFLRRSGRFPLTGQGDVNLYSVFAEMMVASVQPAGMAGFIVSDGIAYNATNARFFEYLMGNKRLESIIGFKNERFLFAGVEHTVTFALVTVGGSRLRFANTEMCWLAWTIAEARDPERRLSLTSEEIALLNPNTSTCPIFRSRRDAELTLAIYRRAPVLVREADPARGVAEENPWGVSFMRMFDMSNDSHLFRTWQQLTDAGLSLGEDGRFDGREEEWLPLYEAKMIHQYDHRFATYDTSAAETRDASAADHANPNWFPLSRYWLDRASLDQVDQAGSNHRLGFRDIARSTDERTGIFALLPRTGFGNKIPLIFTGQTTYLDCCLVANLDSLVEDYSIRQKVGGTTLNYFLVKQFPVLPPHTYTEQLLEEIVARVFELTYTAWDMQPFARDLGYDGPPFAWDEDRRALLRAELDGIYAHLYGLSREDFDYILGTFPIVNRRDRDRFGEERTRRLCLEAYDWYAEEALQRLQSAVNRIEVGLHTLVVGRLGETIANVPEAEQAKAEAERVKQGKPARAATLSDFLGSGYLRNYAPVMKANIDRFEDLFPSKGKADDALGPLVTVRNALAHRKEMVIDGKVRRSGEAAVRWWAERLGVEAGIVAAPSVEARQAPAREA